MLNQPYYQLLEQQRQELKTISENNLDRTGRLRSSLNCIQKTLNLLKEKVKAHPFTSQVEEIFFFKEVKPEFYSDKIYELELYNLEFRNPGGTQEMVNHYLLEELKVIERFFQSNSFHYHYYKANMSELDQHYFLRSSGKEGFLIEVPEADPDFSTFLDYHFAKFKAYERIRTVIVEKLNDSEANSNQTKAFAKSLKWTGETINLVEIAYGIWLTGQINNGNITISEIVRSLEVSLNVHIGDAHRRWVEIARRKRSSPTKHLDNMSAMILKRIDDELEMKD